MIEIDLICPNCGGRLEINMNREKSFCPYCDSEFSVYRKLNENLEKVKELCQEISNVDVQIIASENIRETPEYENAKKYLGVPEDADVFLICDLAIIHACKNGFAITNKGLYLRGDGMEKSKHMIWEQFKTANILGKDSLVIGDVCFVTTDILVAKLTELVKQIQEMI